LIVRIRPAQRWKCEVSVAVDEARHHHASGGVDLDGVARGRQILDPASGPHLFDDPIANQQRTVVDNTKIGEGRPASRFLGAPQSEQLARAPN
jgi:hypothetical protein